MSKKKKLIFGLVILLILVGAVVAVSIVNSIKEANTPVEESSQVLDEVLFDLGNTGNVASMQVTYGSDSYTLVTDGVDELGSTVWIMKEHPDWSLSYMRTYVLSMGVQFYSYMTVEENVTDPARLDEFGLKNPVSSFVVTSVDGETHQVRMGVKSTDKKYVFCQVDDDTNIYACDGSFATYSTYTAAGLRSASIDHVVDTENGTLVKLFCQKSGERPVEIEYDEDRVAVYSQGGATYLGTNLKFLSPYDNDALMVYTGLQAEYFENLPELEIAEVIDANCQDFSIYGLSDEDPVFRETITSRTGDPGEYVYNTTDYIFGYTYKDDTCIYFREGDNNIVFGIDVAGMSGRMFTPFQFVNQLMFYEIISNVDSAELTIDGRTHQLEILREEEKEDSEDSGERLTVYYVDGKLLEKDLFTSLYRAMISVAPDYEIVGNEPIMNEDDIVTFTLHLITGEDKVVTYYRTSEFYYVAQAGEDLWFAAANRYFDDIRTALDACLE
ncbi:MAG: DUF4340 domain-containing protein [Lachnospiraceae bacterium]|nr:DUF4340 domain-containing protein [Lachnospiraceae bacterium]